MAEELDAGGVASLHVLVVGNLTERQLEASDQWEVKRPNSPAANQMPEACEPGQRG